VPELKRANVFEPRFGRRQIETRALTCLERCRKKLALEEVPVPVPVEDWIEAPLGIRFGITDLSYLGEDVLGAAFVKEREILIDERVTQHEGRCRFTCAHELGHLTLHAKQRSVFHETEAEGPGSPGKLEREADRFAAAFLVPLPLLERELAQLYDTHGMNWAHCTLELMQSTPESEWLWRKRVLPMITRRFQVSLSAAVYRCCEIQPLISNAKPLLRQDMADRLLRPTAADANLDSIEIVDGIPKHCDLFSGSKQNVADAR
jgi:Zn-dependent peptidase ImmA (M78 family)